MPCFKNAFLIKIICLLAVAPLFLSSCTYAPYIPDYPVQQGVSTPAVHPVLPAQPRADICHVVGPMESLWRISKMYDVSIESIMKENGLTDKSNVSEGARLVVPKAAPIRPVIPLYPSSKWQYVIVHHSATDVGSASAFNKAHYKRGFWNGLGYHFVIDNGTQSKQDGQIEVSPRWIKQLNGAHCKAGDMNPRAIGICLVGDFTDSRVTAKQMDSLVFLVKRLSDYYKIPGSRIIGHRDAPGAQTECPGRNFPWGEFKRRIGR